MAKNRIADNIFTMFFNSERRFDVGLMSAK
jgi:hypothetical protein